MKYHESGASRPRKTSTFSSTKRNDTTLHRVEWESG
jgi:hypothetical protein